MGQRHTSKRKTSSPSAGKVAAYFGAFLVLVAVVAVGYESPRQAGSQVGTVTSERIASSAAATSSDEDSPSVDQVVATGVAADLAARANLPIASSAANMSVSLSAKSELAQTDTTAITKPQIITPTDGARTIRTHVVKAGESVPDLAARYNVSENTIRWANDLDGSDALEPGSKLVILPTTGVLYTVKPGDDAASIAAKFRASADSLTMYNDLELSGVKSGQRIIVPGGVIPNVPAPQAPASTAPAVAGDSAGSTFNRSNDLFATAGNRYAPGNCTWYVYERRAALKRPIGSFWGNANTWASSARGAGFRVNNSPAPGAILVDQAGYFGHVAIVERVLPNGDVYITEMNNYAYGGFNIVNDRTISAGQASAYQYIH